MSGKRAREAEEPRDLETALRNLRHDEPPRDLVERILADLAALPTPRRRWPDRMRASFQRPWVTWGFRLTTLALLLGIFLSLRDLVALKRGEQESRWKALAPGPQVVGRVQGPSPPEVTFTLVAPQASSVAVVGTFNDWDPGKNPMVRDDQGRWTVRLPLPPGRYKYQFLVDGQFLADPNAVEKETDGFGHENAVLRL